MRLLICTKRDLPGCHFLNCLLPALQRLPGEHSVQVWLADKTRPNEKDNAELAEIAFMERGLPMDQIFPLIDLLPPEQAATATCATWAGLSERYGVTIDVVEEVRSPAALQRLAELAPDLVISARFSHIFTQAAIDLPRLGIINIHPGALPRYAGLFAPMRTVVDGGDELSCSVHWIDAGIDTGPILALLHRPLDRHGGLLRQIADLYPLAIPVVLEEITRLEQGLPRRARPQDRAGRIYRSLPSPADLAAFRATGMTFWHPAEYGEWLKLWQPKETPADFQRVLKALDQTGELADCLPMV